MDQVQITMEADDEGWRQRCNERMERLKATQFPSDEDPPSQLTLWQQDLFWEKNCMDSELQRAVQNGNVDRFIDMLEKVCSEKKLPLSVIFDQVTRGGDSLLHEAASFGRTNIAELIGHHFPELLTKKSIMGDTPLHAAARSKSPDVIKVILSQCDAHRSTCPIENNEDEEEIITRLTNEYGSTALHDVVRYKHVEGVTLLFEADKCVAHYLNKLGVSPLYIAVFQGSQEIVHILLQAPFSDDEPLPKCYGNSPLHAAIFKKNTDLLKHIMEQRIELIYLRDEEGGTPLHYATTRGFVEGVRALLNTPIPTVLEWNSKGHLPIHLACKWGHVKVLKELLHYHQYQQWPKYSGKLLNHKGQNILHIAAKNGRENVVKYLLKFSNVYGNELDKDGNTPLHLAAKNNFPSILLSLTQDVKILLDILNNEGLTPRDILLKYSKVPTTNRLWLSDAVLYTAGAKLSFKTRNNNKNNNNGKGEVAAKQDGMKESINALMLVATLIVTVSFGAAVTVPGYTNINSSNTSGLKGFVLYNSIAMYCSTFGSVVLLWAQFGEYNLAQGSFHLALYMVFLALLTMTLAFSEAVNLVLSHKSWLQYVVHNIGSIFFALISSFGIHLVLVFKTRKSILLPLADFLIFILIPFYKNSPKEKYYKKLENSANYQQAAMHNQNENQ